MPSAYTCRFCVADIGRHGQLRHLDEQRTTTTIAAVSGTHLRKWLSEGSDVPAEFSRPEVLQVLREYYAAL